MNNNSFLRGAALLTFTMFITKLLGFVYIIPFTKLVGVNGYILFEYAYKPYAIMISMATLGIPMAVSKMISKHNELGDYDTGRVLLKTGSFLMTLTGAFWAFILYCFAGNIAGLLISESDVTGNSRSDVTFVIQMISFALVLVPLMALVRGFFQGNQKMMPTAVSQTVEQLVRIIVILSASFIIMRYGSGSVREVIGWSTFAATIAALASMVTLIIFWFKYKNDIPISALDKKKTKVKLLPIYKELFLYSLPFLLISLAVPLYQSIDMFAINPTLVENGKTQFEAEYINSIIAMVQKIVTIPLIFANALALTLVPAITKSFTAKNKNELGNQTSKSLEVILFITIPCSIFLYLMSQETFSFLFGIENGVYGGIATKAYAFNSLFLCMFIVTSAILQGINKHYFAVTTFIFGLIVKLTITTPLIMHYGGEGTALSTNIAFTVSTLLNIYMLRKITKFSLSLFIKRLLKVLLVVILFTISILVLKWAYVHFVEYRITGYLGLGLKLVFTGFGSIITFGLASYKLGILKDYVGIRKSKKNLES